MPPHEYRKREKLTDAVPEARRGLRLTPTGEKAADATERLVDKAEPGAGCYEEPDGTAGERQSRLVGIMLVILGCVLMALAAGEAAAYPALLPF